MTSQVERWNRQCLDVRESIDGRILPQHSPTPALFRYSWHRHADDLDSVADYDSFLEDHIPQIHKQDTPMCHSDHSSEGSER